jgi:hypothetical protein
MRLLQRGPRVLEASGPADPDDPLSSEAKQRAREACIDATACPVCGAPLGQACYRAAGRTRYDWATRSHSHSLYIDKRPPYRTPHRHRWLPFIEDTQ